MYRSSFRSVTAMLVCFRRVRGESRPWRWGLGSCWGGFLRKVLFCAQLWLLGNRAS